MFRLNVCHGQGKSEELCENFTFLSYTSEGTLLDVIRGQKSVMITPPFSSMQSSPLSCLKHPFTDIIWKCRASFGSSSPCPLALSSIDAFSQTMGWWFSHVCCTTPDFSIIPFSQALGVPLVWSLVSVCLQLQRIRYTTFNSLTIGNVSLTLVNIEWRVCPWWLTVHGVLWGCGTGDSTDEWSIEDIRHVCRRFDIRVVFKSGRTIRYIKCEVFTLFFTFTLTMGQEYYVIPSFWSPIGQG